MDVDMVVLAPAMVPGVDTEKLSDMLDLPLDKAGFFEEEHMLLAPVNTAVDGVFIVGCAQGPKDIPDSIVQAQSAAGGILSRLIPGQKLLPEVKVSEVIESLCTGCQTCVTVCSYGAAGYAPRSFGPLGWRGRRFGAGFGRGGGRGFGRGRW